MRDAAGAPLSAYTYDANGNRLSRADGTGTLYGEYDAQDRLIEWGDGISSTTFSYDANGTLRAKTDPDDATTSYTYDATGALRGMLKKDGEGAAVADVRYENDLSGRRIARRAGGETKHWIYAGGINPVIEYNESSASGKLFVYGLGVNVPDFIIDYENGEPVATYRVLTDQLGSVRRVVNVSDGNVAQEISYDEFGRVLYDSNPGFQPFGFAGGLYDPETGLTRFGARDYDPEIGRWTAKDPIPFAGGINAYSYCHADPVNSLDVWGLASDNERIGYVAGRYYHIPPWMGRLGWQWHERHVANVLEDWNSQGWWNAGRRTRANFIKNMENVFLKRINIKGRNGVDLWWGNMNSDRWTTPRGNRPDTWRKYNPGEIDDFMRGIERGFQEWYKEYTRGFHLEYVVIPGVEGGYLVYVPEE